MSADKLPKVTEEMLVVVKPYAYRAPAGTPLVAKRGTECPPVPEDEVEVRRMLEDCARAHLISYSADTGVVNRVLSRYVREVAERENRAMRFRDRIPLWSAVIGALIGGASGAVATWLLTKGG